MTVYKNTYTQLTAFIKFVESFSSAEYPIFEDVSIHIRLPLGNEQRFLLGIAFLETTIDSGLLEFRSNRYFLDAIGIRLLPSKEEVIKEIQRSSKSSLAVTNEVSLVKALQNLGNSISALKASCMSNDLPSIYQGFKFPKVTQCDLEYLDANGYLIIPNAIPLDLCDELQDRVNTLAKWETSSNDAGYVYGSGKMQRIYHLLAKDSIFRDLVLHPVTHIIMSHLFQRNTFHDKYYLTSFHANVIRPNGEPQIWHIDSNVPEPIPSWIIRANSNFIIQDYTEQNGATQLIPKSHLWLRKPNKQEAESIDESQVVSLEAPKGSLAFWHGALWHRSGMNASNGGRTALLATYAASHLREMCMEENPYLSMSMKTIGELTDPLKALVGWNHGAKNY